MTTHTGSTDQAGPPSKELSGKSHLPDRLFFGASSGSGILVVVLVVSVGLFLTATAIPALMKNKVNFLTHRGFDAGDPNNLRFGIADLLWTTTISSIVAMLIAVPIAIGVALFLTQYAHPRLAAPFAGMVDLLAAVPSIVYGLWGLLVLGPVIKPVETFLQKTLGWTPLFEQTTVSMGTVFLASVVLAIMILPIVTAITREVFAQVPSAHKEGALALGATKWEMIRTAVLPFGKPGIISASMLGLGRALGETIAVMIILSVAAGDFSWSLFFGGRTFASLIASSAQEFDSPEKAGAFIAAGLVLFVLTFIVNAIARVVIERRKAFSE